MSSIFSFGKNQNNNNNKGSNALTSLISLVVVIIALVYVFDDSDFKDLLSIFSLDISDTGGYSGGGSEETPNEFGGKNLIIKYLDVGQTDSVLIQLPNGENMLIDAGNTKTTEYLKSLAIKTIDYMIMTHPHADHIGGMADVIENFTVKSIYMPRIDDEDLPTTKVYTNFLKVAKSHNITINECSNDDTLFEFEGLKAETLAPIGSGYSDLNDYSIVLRLQYVTNVFVFSGDAETQSEHEIVSNYDPDYLDCDVLQCGHHGSKTSTTEEYLSVLKPEYAVISVGEDNTYGHPTKETLARLNDIDAEIYRTDLNGTVTCTSDGENITFNTTKGNKA